MSMIDKFISPEKVVEIKGVQITLRGLRRKQINKLELMRMGTFKNQKEMLDATYAYGAMVCRALIKDVKNLYIGDEEFQLEFTDESKVLLTEECLEMLDMIFCNFLDEAEYYKIIQEHYNNAATFIPTGVKIKDTDKKKE